jgi:hypothetical protein
LSYVGTPVNRVPSAQWARTLRPVTYEFGNNAGTLKRAFPIALSAPSRTRLGNHLAQLARTHGRRLSPADQQLVDAVTEHVPPPAAMRKVARIEKAKTDTATSASLPEILTRWRTAEVATMEFLNARGWKLRDVSAQNAGYDLEGVDPNGDAVGIEVKKVDQPDAQFSMTNNELSLMMHTPQGTW